MLAMSGSCGDRFLTKYTNAPRVKQLKLGKNIVSDIYRTGSMRFGEDSHLHVDRILENFLIFHEKYPSEEKSVFERMRVSR